MFIDYFIVGSIIFSFAKIQKNRFTPYYIIYKKL